MASKYEPGLTRMAAAIQAQFGVACSKQNLQHWKKNSPPLPAPECSNKYNREEVFAWYAANIAPKPKTEAEADIFHRAKIAEAENKITDAADAKTKYDKLIGKLIDKDAARRAVIGVAKAYHNIVRSKLEVHLTSDRRDWLTTRGVAPEIVANFYEFDLSLAQKLVTEIESECERQGKAGI